MHKIKSVVGCVSHMYIFLLLNVDSGSFFFVLLLFIARGKAGGGGSFTLIQVLICITHAHMPTRFGNIISLDPSRRIY